MTFIEHVVEPRNPDSPLRKIKVKVDDRNFTVTLASSGAPLRVTERRMHMPGTVYASWYNAPYWHWLHHRQPKKSTSLIARIFAAAAEIDEAQS